ncbi:MAG: hypothetical protein ABI638_10995, partial [Ignavibacteriota bacterium]
LQPTHYAMEAREALFLSKILGAKNDLPLPQHKTQTLQRVRASSYYKDKLRESIINCAQQAVLQKSGFSG